MMVNIRDMVDILKFEAIYTNKELVQEFMRGLCDGWQDTPQVHGLEDLWTTTYRVAFGWGRGLWNWSRQ